MDLFLLGNIINTIGAIFLVASYIPQIQMLLKTKNAEGMSIKFWAILIIGMSGLLFNMCVVGAGAFVIGTQVINIALAVWVMILAIKYQKKA